MTEAPSWVDGVAHSATCFVCGAAAVVWSGHVHDDDGGKRLAGWCALHQEEKNRAQSCVVPAIAEAFPNRKAAWDQLTAHALPGCAGCFGPSSHGGSRA